MALPLVPGLALSVFFVARPIKKHQALVDAAVSIIIPVRNEAGNMENAVRNVPQLAPRQELIFVEGGSRDNTWEVLQKLPAQFPDKAITITRQPGKGKADAVQEGFRLATGDIFMILDGDLTMPPEELPKYYEALVSGRAEFANGVRLVYPMAETAMPFLNFCANKFFAILFTWLVGQPVKDTLCGTKVLTRTNYEKIAAGRKYFGDFDPFGDFDLIFGAAKIEPAHCGYSHPLQGAHLR